ncbi:hypothetical protein pEaSNUABM30_00044 [Erwinia phage pEa_SNUABM_30]|uniref:Uncharacterized protein n=1 Tax=Erwinia phage pEa_SNUABM_30 TaxID=2869553 RepID=A0AAE9BRQ5_9CAUD|nr:hypothetical protein MPK69_gp044 [Erwinia phage pEa_SNUABM_30]UAW53162.1 hypothetical protein pEaSNUABM30_00044 [Erwinia phage pEa_SNUABM_30]
MNNNILLIKRVSSYLYVGYCENASDIPRRGVEMLDIVVPSPVSGDSDNILDMKARCIYHLPHNCFLLQHVDGEFEGNEYPAWTKKHCRDNMEIFQRSSHGREQAAIELMLNELRDAEVEHPEWPEEAIHAGSILVEEAGELLRDCVSFDETGDDKLIVNMQIEAVQTGAMALRFLKNLSTSQKRTIPHNALRTILNSEMTPEEQLAEMRRLIDHGVR